MMTTVNPEHNDDCYSASNFNQLCQDFDRLNEKYLALKKACAEAEPVAYIYPPSKLNSTPLAYSAEEMKCDGVSTDGYIPAFIHPASVIASEQKPVAKVVCNSAGQISIFDPAGNMFDVSQYIGCQLFTSPPNTADLEQRVAEACAELIITDAGTCDSHVIATQLICGKWREYL